MGLCKCPKRKVTNLFCFEHRVNVCEHCIVSEHSRCVVQSYLQWLQDSDFKPECSLCNTALESGEVLRLVCYDVFHVRCLDQYASSLPANTAPAGYTCPKCKSGIFPAENHISPIVDEIRCVLAQFRWAQAGLGRPIVDDSKLSAGADVPDHPGPDDSGAVTSSTAPSADVAAAQLDQAIARATRDHQGAGYDEIMSHSGQPQPEARHHVSTVSANDNSSRSSGVVSTGTAGYSDSHYTQRKVVDSRSPHDTQLQMMEDHDEDKYRRRSPFDLLVRWLGLRTKPGKSRNALEGSTFALRRATIMIVIVIIGVMTFIVLFTRVSSSNRSDRGFLDPLDNPNIHVEHN